VQARFGNEQAARPEPSRSNHPQQHAVFLDEMMRQGNPDMDNNHDEQQPGNR